jgi:hypothetical protein
LPVIQKLSTEIDNRFNRMILSTDSRFDPMYFLATLLDPRYALLLDEDAFEIAKSELKLMVTFIYFSVEILFITALF